ncbi:sigma-54 dependent transcriptional regulator [Telmatobacter sp. DSM 110680]|uniref:Sigma-54 dependent transcriptional regulator n=1 Tax=Telmatobacter sp. DSM 110680 TaxID=3036704 RepID=A0AAU7DCW6_9BACT
MKPTLLILSVLRSADTRTILDGFLKTSGHRAVHASSCEQASILLANALDPDLVIIESSLEMDSGVLYRTLQAASGSAVCLVYGAGEQHYKNQAAKAGIEFFIQRPFSRCDLGKMFEQLCIANSDDMECGHEGAPALEPIRSSATHADHVLEELGEGRYFFAGAPSMLKIYRQIQLLAEVDAPVLILGESGTGKEVIAHLIHKHSRRSQHSFVNVNCAALPSDLLESELFGYQQGAFTGAIKDKPGKFEQANRGTLLLDEIGEMSAPMQAKLLHVLQDGQFTRLGARESSKVDVRVLAATNIQIESALVGKSFREDLFYRLNVFTISVPPLRERREEIPFLIEETIRRSPESLRNGSEFVFSSRLLDAALLCDWRGNVRELRNFVTRTMTMRDSDAAIRELEAKVVATTQVVSAMSSPEQHSEHTGMRSVVRDMKDRAEAQMIQEALEVSGWNRRHAAKYLNISYRGLLYKIQQLQLSPRSSSRPHARV